MIVQGIYVVDAGFISNITEVKKKLKKMVSAHASAFAFESPYDSLYMLTLVFLMPCTTCVFL